MYLLMRNLATCSLMESYTPEGWIIVDVRDLSDVERKVDKVIKKITVIGGLLGMGQNVAVRCVAGMNRSNAIAMGVLCWFSPRGDIDATWDYHFNKVKTKCPRMMITIEMERIVKKAVLHLRHNHMECLKGINLENT